MSDIGASPLRPTPALMRSCSRRLARDASDLEAAVLGSSRVKVIVHRFAAEVVEAITVVFPSVRTLFRDGSRGGEVIVRPHRVVVAVNPHSSDLLPYPFTKPQVLVMFPGLLPHLEPYLPNVLLVNPPPGIVPRLPPEAVESGVGPGAVGAVCFTRTWLPETHDLKYVAHKVHFVVTGAMLSTSPNDALNSAASVWCLEDHARRLRTGEKPLFPTEGPLPELAQVAPGASRSAGFTLREIGR